MSVVRNPFKTATLTIIWGWLIVLVLAPTLLVVLVSLMPEGSGQLLSGDISPATLWQGLLTNYGQMISPVYLGVFGHSLWIGLVTTLICLVLGYPFAWMISRASPRMQPLLLLLVIIPFWTNSLIRIYALRTLIATRGLLNDVLMTLGLIDTPLRLLYTEEAVIIGLVYMLLPFMILPLYAVFEQLSRPTLEAARDLGANGLATFRHVVLPLTMPGIIAGVLLVFLPAMGMFYVSDLLGGSRHPLIGNIIKGQFLEANNWSFGAAISVMLTLVMAFLLLAYYRSVKLFKREVTL
ncbi:spermidine/putrescine ABC transporter permease PotB [Cobetia sp. 14N.309.X.WAT.E.A4]|jgi:spermidine/putrescine transport system permease protein|uniref:Spermidine/putrescine ABC transporter permease PotB n=1 Tax=Cobetia marina TaxID=28258 RepID=A0ABU9GD40_COBMA|nr:MULTISPECIES: spermidine/putrescine ABC transporter permease PotB [Cobetia]MDA5563473.1 spermidine/putrescine ABC transporter permease PotB [Cobetia sp. MMG027]MDH2289660.1 spermidine/putrescine ABC transporter permease PotB [Cobetia sp. 10Alg 146]MDN2655885.1 spermidine/putrescine ABC transporter permease PotB [Cobetia sp. 14N.309.X.WAT.E.A4]POR06473.1 spermidine/putrescine ABC transporter permease PotB [Cobetia sp. MM1IDA2H-1]